MAEREITQTIAAKVPKYMVKLNKGGPVAITARMLAWKQPFI
jgi:hypothetical protein